MPDLSQLTLSTFAPLVGDTFSMRSANDLRVEVSLSEATAIGDQPLPTGRVAFSILFSGPPDPILPQGTHQLTHHTLGTLDVFLVPLQPEDGRARYQAVFA